MISVRRHHKRRIRKKRAHYCNGHIGKFVETPKMCSCWMCGNPRRYAKGKEQLTIQERRFQDSEIEE
ncbi:MAG: hypothetical protein NC112_08080 [Oxalobacter formigenes]|nr:hypothetical protein [Oxalobacter formigenes]